MRSTRRLIDSPPAAAFVFPVPPNLTNLTNDIKANNHLRSDPRSSSLGVRLPSPHAFGSTLYLHTPRLSSCTSAASSFSFDRPRSRRQRTRKMARDLNAEDTGVFHPFWWRVGARPEACAVALSPSSTLPSKLAAFCIKLLCPAPSDPRAGYRSPSSAPVWPTLVIHPVFLRVPTLRRAAGLLPPQSPHSALEENSPPRTSIVAAPRYKEPIEAPITDPDIRLVHIEGRTMPIYLEGQQDICFHAMHVRYSDTRSGLPHRHGSPTNRYVYGLLAPRSYTPLSALWLLLPEARFHTDVPYFRYPARSGREPSAARTRVHVHLAGILIDCGVGSGIWSGHMKSIIPLPFPRYLAHPPCNASSKMVSTGSPLRVVIDVGLGTEPAVEPHTLYMTAFLELIVSFNVFWVEQSSEKSCSGLNGIEPVPSRSKPKWL
ncbi:hypothetical protein C8R44DRAFT_752725 [Mycena epipterygia]|nr:hypothetical protein C8R44DRAFT_752725 [Mycena epipterygia]